MIEQQRWLISILLAILAILLITAAFVLETFELAGRSVTFYLGASGSTLAAMLLYTNIIMDRIERAVNDAKRDIDENVDRITAEIGKKIDRIAAELEDISRKSR